MRERYVNIGVYLATAVALIDQFSKWWLLHIAMNPPRTIPVTSFFNLVLSWNRGVTFGLFNRDNAWMSYVFIGAAVIILLLLLAWLMRATSLKVALGLGLVMGGAVGNIVDRIRYSAVLDFLDFHAFGYHWYAFNAADSAIVCGVGLLLLDNLVSNTKKG
ncbi:MAG: signal peptidase II [Alphaproteobacteria bacterium]|nr:signal peptidase II [Alphaproteobacteria bacterium]